MQYCIIKSRLGYVSVGVFKLGQRRCVQVSSIAISVHRVCKQLHNIPVLYLAPLHSNFLQITFNYRQRLFQILSSFRQSITYESFPCTLIMKAFISHGSLRNPRLCRPTQRTITCCTKLYHSSSWQGLNSCARMPELATRRRCRHTSSATSAGHWRSLM